jgi:multidrug resistance protein MdtO
MLRVIPHVTDIASLAILVSIGTFIGAWVAGGDKHISYAGFQIAFAYLLCVVQGPSPMFDLVVARDRVIGILIGNVVSYLVATHIWPVSVSGRIEATSRVSWHSLPRMADAGDLWSTRRAAAENRRMLEDLSSDILLATYEPARIRPRCAWLAAQQRANHAARKLNEVLLDWLEIIPQHSKGALRAILAGDLLAANGPVTIPREDQQLESLLRSRMAALHAARAAIDEVTDHD